MASKKKNIKKRPTLYNKILKEFTKINNQLPEDRKLSIKERRQLIKDRIYPEFFGASSSRVAKSAIQGMITQVLDTIPPKEACDVNYISPSVYANIGWFELDDFIMSVLPDCIYIRIDAGRFGKTRIFNTRNYNYTRNGVKQIVENIREQVENDSSVDISFTGFKKLRKGKTNDGTPENYFIDFIVVINGEASREIDPVIYDLPKEEKKKARRVKDVILNRVKELTNKKRRKKRARKSAKQTINVLKKLSQRQKQSKKQQTKDKYAEAKMLYFEQRRRQIDKDYRLGLLTDEQYKRFIQEMYEKVFGNYNKGGQV